MFSGLNENETKKLAAFELLRKENAPRDQTLGGFAQLARQLIGVSGCFVTIFDDKYQYIKYAFNLASVPETLPADETMCKYSVGTCKPVICPDARLDPRFTRHPLVVEGAIVFYAAAPLKTKDNFVLGTLCVCDASPALPTPEQIEQFLQLAALASAYLESWYSVGRMDALTALPNRQSLLEEVNSLSRVENAGNYTLIIFDCIDINRAYELSRYLGIAAVENMLRNFAPLLRIRLDLDPSVILYAFATARYALLMKEDLADELIQQAVGFPATQAKITGDIEISLSMHVGYFTFDPAVINAQEVLRKTVSALHEAIRQDAPVRAFDPEMDEKRNQEFRLLYDLGEALKSEGQLYLAYQPKISLINGEIKGVEALLRWQHPTLGNISPAIIVTLAERTSLMAEITQWVIRRTLSQITEWRASGVNIPVSINITVSDFSSAGFSLRLTRQIIAAGLTPADIRLECLETEKMLESPAALNELDILKSIGFIILLDDFGAGNSNINYLRRIPVDTIKLDRSLISQVTSDSGSRIIARNVVVMLKELNYTVLAEGVEDRETALLLKSFGCDEAQGYYFAMPMPPEEIPAWIAANPTPDKLRP
ncbi:sensor domain-containing phosphodiesterase [Superficieibacter sp. 1612_C1]|uniref:sensor domain-containing diguanylate cyclase n=1 Tax=Superficieibacter sp. 1612_C1 TaxID=2780382 RepID=UPI001883FDA9|nr:sensor domain-containing phosphodiesterase [Superficieibacter sp. 1612_C1]